jgi:hypothetical protein
MLTRDLIRLSAVLFGAAGIVASYGIYQLRAPLPDLSARPLPEWQPELAAEPELLDAPVATLQESLARPLFRSSRSPFDPTIPQQQPEALIAVAEPVYEPPPPDVSQLLVKGIMMEGKKQLALVATAEAPDGVWLGLGAEISGWTIAGLNREGVTLESGEARATLKLYVDNP